VFDIFIYVLQCECVCLNVQMYASSCIAYTDGDSYNKMKFPLTVFSTIGPCFIWLSRIIGAPLCLTQVLPRKLNILQSGFEVGNQHVRRLYAKQQTGWKPLFIFQILRSEEMISQ
jgi:hypothetical protein